jgi:hypothetical protein
LGLGGRWEVAEPPLGKPDDLSSYVASWLPGEARGNTEKN